MTGPATFLALTFGSGILVILAFAITGAKHIQITDAIERWRSRLPRLGP